MRRFLILMMLACLCNCTFGTYKITLKSDAKQLIVTAEAIGYEKTKREIKNV